MLFLSIVIWRLQILVITISRELRKIMNCRSLGRLEARMEAVTSMIKQIVNKHSQQNVAYARTPNVMPPRVSELSL